MSQPPDEEDDQIFSGKALGDDGALRPASGAPILQEIPEPAETPRAPGSSLLDDPAYEATVISTPPRVRDVADRPAPVELAEMQPPPSVSDYVQPRKEKAVRYGTPDTDWGRWVRRALVVGVLAAGAWVLATGKIPGWKGFSFDLLRKGEKKEEVPQKRVGTPAPTLLVLSEPSGATVLVGGSEVGVTPWAGDNVWPSKEPLRVEVRKPGYKPWMGLTMGGQQATLEATLKKR
ncbi:MAG TPA: PEGA domain-containing protein [Myxococcaceae bacterium]|jgi:serine/threonine-protein kinase